MKIGAEKLKEIIKLEQKKYRQQKEEYLIFGKHIVEEAINAKSVKYILVNDENLISEYMKLGLSVYEVSNKDITKFKSLKTVPEVIAVCKMEQKVEFTCSNVLGINKINNPSNLGAILRSAKAFGFDNVYLDLETVDLYNSKTIQSMQGANFLLNIKQGDLYEFCVQNNTEYNVITTFLDEENNYDVKETKQSEKRNLLIVGNEALGIEKVFKNLKHENFKINIAYESLNVVVATSIIMYEIAKGNKL